MSGYENVDSYIDEDQQLRHELRITAADEIEGRKRGAAQFQIEF